MFRGDLRLTATKVKAAGILGGLDHLSGGFETLLATAPDRFLFHLSVENGLIEDLCLVTEALAVSSVHLFFRVCVV